MNFIRKTSEPQSLTEYKKTPGADFNSCNKADIQLSLLAEQKELCAYCMSRISMKRNDVLKKPRIEIEHYRSQDVYNGTNGKPDLRLDYNNMLGVCNGHAGESNFEIHCDKSKDLFKNKVNLPLTIDPLNSISVKLLDFKSDGRIESRDTTIKKDICTLNLNTTVLKDNRKSVIDIVIEYLSSKSGKDNIWLKTDVEKEILKWKTATDGKLREYNRAVIYFLNKKLTKVF